MLLFREHDKNNLNKISLGRVLEIHKFTWPLVSLLFGLIYQNYSFRMTLMHSYFSSYGLLWVLKSNIYPDKNFYFNEEHKLTTFGVITSYTSISVYYLFPFVTAKNTIEISKLEILVSSLFYSFGLLLHHGADIQKYFQLKYIPGKLIKNGFFSIVRHPNYTGEFMIWIGLILISGKEELLSYVPLCWLTVATILVGMPVKEYSLKRYDDYKYWHENTYAIIPGIY